MDTLIPLGLKEICDVIGYIDENPYEWKSNNFYKLNITGYEYVIVTPQEIIFNPKFKEKFEDYYYGENYGTLYDFDQILEHLDKPVHYLYNILFKKTLKI